MRLYQFIRSEMEGILVQWEAFAATLTPGMEMDQAALRDHAREILEAIATDIESAQTRDEQTLKSQGHAKSLVGAGETAAQAHAEQRAQSAFDINQTVAEYRALRASVLRLWKDAHGASAEEFDDMLRFNEGIDQAIAESVRTFELHVERARNLLLGMLGHDMRSPLGTIQATAEYLGRLNAGADISTAAARLIRSGHSMKTLLDDLVDFNRTRLGLGIRIDRREVDLARLAEDEIDQLRSAHPSYSIELAILGDVSGRFDADRFQQLLRNLVSNAVVHGAADSIVQVSVAATAADVSLRVSNNGEAIDAAHLAQLFEPLVEGNQRARGKDHLGLGLYIVREITRAHGGTVGVRSDAEATVFTATLLKA